MIHPTWCRHMTRPDEVILPIPSDAAYRLWAKGKLFLFHGWFEVVVQLGLKKGSLLVFNPLDATTFKVSYFIDGVIGNSYWTWLTSASCRFSVIPEFILPNCYAYTSTDVNAVIYIGNNMFDVKIQTIGGQAGFSKGIDVVVHQFHLEAGCYMVFAKLFG
ncbi:hypothetical protein HanRHA438_Chr07g0302851 [Helianthus annuus]|uniref:DNA-binding pseudobarrel domain-containing protein n=1 Tax=Helianthus annuus TaxID=4232 RepID=A0A9K3IKP8_HELAN|nr:hypothetical protein HanXRQr2_Chr07g0292341 [Helianthus annuus]KAJ0549991.1 hypothetical protein HanHA300_Chr07g0240361 [Helianthus annuus]KAJ0556572.1 hypothetical protein HanIR_Chr07g0315381 [Helianthus annuus]KAJ0562951.1 hypothetical protein HanHA89_Chr07g0257591 [Helianthus annuus]KAJ0731085.1 hypothetical protein HanOQP8_Chr07g0247921 [Helianthus annuus]